MQRYFIKSEQWQDNYVTMEQDDYHHIKHVMRMNVSDSVVCVHPNGAVAICQITTITDQQIIAEITEWVQEDNELPVMVTIIQGLPKKNKLELILQKGTELGCSEFYLVETDRSIVQWDQKKKKQKQTRYEKIIKEASEQCHRSQVPSLYNLESLESLLQNHSFDVILFAYEQEAKQKEHSSFGHVVKSLKPGQHIGICIGPEGGFSEKEVALFKEYDVMSIRLGPRILRTETASLYALASISYHFEELEC